MKRIILAIMTFFMPVSAWAQASCKDVLAVAYNIQESNVSNKSFSIAKSHACSSNKSASSAGGTIVVEEVPVTLDLSQEETNAWCRNDFQSTIIDNQFRSKILSVHDLVIQKWASCMDSSGIGLRVSLTPMLEATKVLLTLQYNSYDGAVTTRILPPVFSNLNCPVIPIDVGKRKHYVCSRDPELDTSAVINVVKGPSPDLVELKGMHTPSATVPAYNNVTGWYSLSIDPAYIRLDQTGVNLNYYFRANVLNISGLGGFINPSTVVGQETVVRPDGSSCSGIFKITFSSSTGFTRIVKKYPQSQPNCIPAPLQFDVLTGSAYLADQNP